MKRVTLCIFCLTLLLSGCSSSGDKPEPEQGKPRPGITGALSPSAAPTPSTEPLFSPTPTLTPIPDGKLLGWLLVEEQRHVDGKDVLVQKSYDEKNRLVKTETYQRDVSGDVLLDAEEYTYDKQGNCILHVSVYESGGKEIEENAYDDGRLTHIKRQFCDPDGTPWQTEIYTVLEDETIRYENRREDNSLRYYSLIQRDAAGNVIEERSFLEDGTCCTIYKAKYGEHGILSSEEKDFDVWREGGATSATTDYSYDMEGNLIKKTALISFLNIDYWYREEEEYRYEKGKLVHKVFVKTISGQEESSVREEEAYRYEYEEQTYAARWYNGVLQEQEEWRCTFDKDGRLLEKVLLKEDGTDTLHKKTYRYDDYGNCIEILDRQGARKDIYRYVYEPIFAAD